jgi:hypothetical protein
VLTRTTSIDILASRLVFAKEGAYVASSHSHSNRTQSRGPATGAHGSRSRTKTGGAGDRDLQLYALPKGGGDKLSGSKSDGRTSSQEYIIEGGVRAPSASPSELEEGHGRGINKTVEFKVFEVRKHQD